MKNKKILTIALTIFGLGIIGVGAYFVLKPSEAKSDGEITVKVVELENVLVKEKKIPYNEGDTLVSLVESNFSNVVITDGMLMSIETLTIPSDWSTYICIYKNNEMSNVGIKDITFTTGDVISFVNTAWAM